MGWSSHFGIHSSIQHPLPFFTKRASNDQILVAEGKMSWYLECLKKYAQFSGRARRKEYWMFMLFNILIVLALLVIGGATSRPTDGSSGTPGILILYRLAVFLPSLAVGVRRMHDTGFSGWWLIVPFVGLFLTFREGDDGDNRFGADPKAMVIETSDSLTTVANA
jgi:uncharacterized membrane protein YhaH (DUF805 family)